MYWLSLAEREHRSALGKVYLNVDKEVKTLPFHLKEEVTKKINKEVMSEFFPQQHEPALLYWEQLLRIFPDEKTNQWLLSWQITKDVVEQRR